jgi:hypothetical protein
MTGDPACPSALAAPDACLNHENQNSDYILRFVISRALVEN